MLDPSCLMAFPGADVLRTADIIINITAVRRWTSVQITGRAVGQAGDNVIVLGYSAEGRRVEGEPSRCVCTSTYRSDGRAWKLVQHQQTIAGS